MCGISGFISKKKIDLANIKKTLLLMRNRGPDNQSFYVDNYKNNFFGLLHTRLSILDVEKRSNQPFEDGPYKLIYNGEIYNYLEIKKELIKKNYKFKTQSDTEVLLKSYIEYGEKCVNYFDGMWSFCIWDNNKKKMFLSRDIFGEKPLYYIKNNNSFIFGSEIKFIKSLLNEQLALNKTKINDFLFNGYKSLNKKNDTFYKKIISLEPGNNLVIDQNFRQKKYKFWRPQKKNNFYKDYNEIVESTREILIKTVKSRMQSDVPLAFCLSGGVDSSGLVSIAKKILNKKVYCFSLIDTDQRYNEIKNIEKIQNDLNIKVDFIKFGNFKKDFLNKTKSLIDYHDGPISTISYYIQSYLYNVMSRKNFKVSISGTGADEIFTGYYDHFLQFFKSITQKKRDKKLLNDNVKYWNKYILPNIRNPYLRKFNFYINNPNNRKNIYEEYFNLKNFSTHKIKISNFYEKKYSQDLLRNRMLNELFKEVIPVILKHDDLNAMQNSIENRSPYLNKELFENSLNIPTRFLISEGYQKKILRDCLKNILIDDVRLDRQKKGFNSSINSVFDLTSKENISYLFEKKSPINEFVNLKLLKKMIKRKKLPNHLSKFIFSTINTKIFLENNNL